jgi:hypothetical protein
LPQTRSRNKVFICRKQEAEIKFLFAANKKQK